MSRALRNPKLEERLRRSEEDSRRLYRDADDIGRRVDSVTKVLDDSDDGVITIAIEDEDSIVTHVDDLRNSVRGQA